MCVFFGEDGELGRSLAYAQGQALQLTNILRDIHEDSARGRLYLPRELLIAHNVPLDPILALQHPSLPCVWRALSEDYTGIFQASGFTFIAFIAFEDMACAYYA